MLAEPARTNYDLEFRIFGFDVRIHPLFFALAAILPLISSRSIYVVPVWIVVVFVSILVHELGHTFAMRYYGSEARIVLYMMGGLAIPTDSWNVRARRSTPYSQIVISAAGPLAGFVLAIGVIGAIKLIGGDFILHFNSIYFWQFQLPFAIPLNPVGVPNGSYFLYELFSVALFVNILWGLMNLLPVYPLDGGQISREIFTKFDAWNGVKKSLLLSAFVGGAIAVWGLTKGDLFIMFLFGSLALQSWQAAQNMGGGGGFGGGSNRPW